MKGFDFESYLDERRKQFQSCKGCKWEEASYTIDNPPCYHCERLYLDYYEEKDEE